MRRKRWEPGTTAVLGVRTWFYPYRDGELLFGDGPLKSAGTLVRVLSTRRGASLRRVLVEAGIGGSGPYAWVDADDLEPVGDSAPECEHCGSVLSAVTWTCVRGEFCPGARAKRAH